MRFHRFDFLSSSPQNFIFQRNSNKTNLGGVLSMIYLIILLIISISYLVFYSMEDNYTIEYLYYEKLLTREENLEKKNSPKYNPKFDFEIGLYEGSINSGKPAGDRFIIKDLMQEGSHIVNNFGTYSKRITEVDWLILYDCLNETSKNCNINYTETQYNYVTFLLSFKGYIFDHQNKDSPFHILDDGSSLDYIPTFYLNNPFARGNIWSVVKYKEEKGFFAIFDIFKNKNEDDDKYIGAVVKSFEDYELSNDFNSKNIFYIERINNNTIHYYKVIGELYFDIDFNHYEEYKRTPKSFWDIVANICSLSTTIFNGFGYIFINYYSNSFDNYKIMEKILFNSNSNKSEKKEECFKQIELNNDFNEKEKSDSLLEKPTEDKNKIISSETDNIDNEDNKRFIDDNKDNYYDDENLPKLRFIDFLLNNFYNDKCCKQIRQKIIEKCNEIISKYYSIECILYNQIKLENLLKDYKWNDPRLNIIDNNELVIQLKNLLYSFKKN